MALLRPRTAASSAKRKYVEISSSDSNTSQSGDSSDSASSTSSDDEIPTMSKQVQKISKLRGVAIVSLHVGKEKPPFQVHKSILSDASPFFDAAFNGSFSESVTHSMDLPDEDPEAFEALLQWIYFRTYEIPPFDSARRDARASYMKLARLYVSADKFQMTALKNEVIDRWYGISHEAWLADKEAVDYVYENTSATSTLRRLVVADYVWRRRANWYGSEKADLQFRERSDLATDVLIAMVQKNEEEEENPFTLGSAHFHDTPAEPKRKP